MLKRRTTLLSVLVVFILTIGAVVQAQDAMPFDPCFGLAEADCAVINTANENGLGDAQSFTVDVMIDFSGSELSGLFTMMSAMQPEAELSMLENLNDATFYMDGTFDVVLDETGEEPSSVAGSFTMSFSAGDEPVELAYEVIAVDDMLYLNDGSGWKFVDPERLEEDESMAAIAGSFGGMGMGMGMDSDAMEEGDATMMGFDPDSMMSTFSLIELPGFISYERDGDNFVFNIDFSALQVLLTDEYTDQYTELVESAAAENPQMAFMIPALISIFETGTFTAVQTVDTDANIVTNLDVDMDLDLALALITGEPELAEITLQANIAFSNFDAISPAEAPADAVDGTDEFIEMINTMMASMMPMPEGDE